MASWCWTCERCLLSRKTALWRRVGGRLWTPKRRRKPMPLRVVRRMNDMRIILVIAGLIFAGRQPASAAEPLDTKAIDFLVQKALADWHVPGAAVAIVRDDEVIYLK